MNVTLGSIQQINQIGSFRVRLSGLCHPAKHAMYVFCLKCQYDCIYCIKVTPQSYFFRKHDAAFHKLQLTKGNKNLSLFGRCSKSNFLRWKGEGFFDTRLQYTTMRKKNLVHFLESLIFIKS